MYSCKWDKKKCVSSVNVDQKQRKLEIKGIPVKSKEHTVEIVQKVAETNLHW